MLENLEYFCEKLVATNLLSYIEEKIMKPKISEILENEFGAEVEKTSLST